ncbi:MAG: hypothetical protein AAF658_00275 [Myxococcota bacterium]
MGKNRVDGPSSTTRAERNPDVFQDRDRVIKTNQVQSPFQLDQYDRHQIDVALNMARGRCGLAIECRDAHARLGRRLLRQTEIPGRDLTVDQALDAMQDSVEGWIREKPIVGVPLGAVALYADGFDLAVTERWTAGSVQVGLDAGSFASDLDLFARMTHRFNDETVLSTRANYDVETGLVGGVLELIHHQRDGRYTAVFHGGVANKPYRVRRTVSQWPLNDTTAQWNHHPQYILEEYEDEVRYRVGVAFIYRFGAD